MKVSAFCPRRTPRSATVALRVYDLPGGCPISFLEVRADARAFLDTEGEERRVVVQAERPSATGEPLSARAELGPVRSGSSHVVLTSEHLSRTLRTLTSASRSETRERPLRLRPGTAAAR